MDNRKGFAGYEFDPVLNGAGTVSGQAVPLYHVRNRVLNCYTGKWMQVDPLGYHDSMDLYEYCKSSPEDKTDAKGLACGGVSVKSARSASKQPDFPFDPMLPDDSRPGLPGSTRQLCRVRLPALVSPSDKECCDAIRSSPSCREINRRDNAGTICCGGRAVTCEWERYDSPLPGDDILSECRHVHEGVHAKRTDCSNCPTGYACLPAFGPGVDQNAEECDAHMAQLLCLLQRYSRCSTGRYDDVDARYCMRRVWDEMRMVCRIAAEKCNPGLESPPRPWMCDMFYDPRIIFPWR